MANFPSPATAAAGVLLATLIGSPLEAIANDYAYMTDGMSNFGVVDLARGVFTVCGKTGPVLTGLAVGPDHQLYSGMYSIKLFVAIDRTNGHWTTVGVSNVDFSSTGSTTQAVYAMGKDANLYEVDVSTGQGRLIGPTGIPIDQEGWYGMSTNAKTLYMTYNENFYEIDVATGAATLIGQTGQSFGGMVRENQNLYGGSRSNAVYTIDPKTATATFVKSLKPPADAAWGLAPIKAKSIPKSKLCHKHKM